MFSSRKFCWAGVLIVSFAALNVSGQIYVDGQVSSCTNYNPASRTCGDGTNRVYKTIAAASANATGGLTVMVRAGTYPEQLSPVNSGTAGNPITFQNYPGEQVFLTGAPGISLVGRSYIVMDGFRVENTTWLEAQNSHHNVLRNCVFKKSPATGTTGNVRFVQSNYNLIEKNSMEDGQDNLLLIDANYNVVQNNTIKEARHSVLGIRCGDFNVIRSNYFSNTQQKIMEVYDCGVDTSAVPHSFNSTHHNVIENNVFATASRYYSTSGGNGIQYAAQDGIIRRNLFFDCNVGLSLGTYADEGLFNVNNRIYHNVFFANQAGGMALNAGDIGNVIKNNTFTGNNGCVPDCFATSPGQIIYRLPFSGNFLERNHFFASQTGDKVLEEEGYKGFSLTEFVAMFPAVLTNSLEADPKFADAAVHDFYLQKTSPLIDAGAFLTQTVSGGSGTNLPVLDAFNFYDGFGIVGETGDLVQLEGQTESARIVRVDYANNLLQLATPLTWNAGQKLSLKFNGPAPDIGAFEFQPPVLKLNWTVTTNALICRWPVEMTNAQLMVSSSAGNPGWNSAGAPTLVNGEWMMTNYFTNQNSFFILKMN
ncbi:MAG: right-handed parallel beta-helix repeat-containing protein [Verrucomicrobiota bacterium]